MKAKQESSLRRVLCPRTLITFAILVLFSCSQKALAQQWNTNGNDISNANSGNVGIGTTTPATALHVATESTAVPRGITNSQHTSDNNSALLTFRKSRGTKLSPAATLNGDNIGNFFAEAYDGSSWVSGARFRFSIDGTVAIGSVPTSIQFFTGSSAQGIERMRISSAGNVGIGTSSPADPLHLYSTANNVGTMRIQGGNTYAGFVGMWDGGPSLLLSNNRHPGTGANFNTASAGAQITLGTLSTPGDMMFSTTSNGMNGMALELMRIKSTGNIGIGTANPGNKLHIVAGTDTYTNLLNLDTGIHLGTVFGVGGTINNESVFGIQVYRAGQYFTRLYVDQFGRLSLQPNGDAHVGIGTSAPNYRLDVQGGQINSSGGLCIAGDCKTAWSQVGGGSSQWTTSGSNIYYNTGNVGVGTSTPGVALDVSQNKAIRVGNANLSSGGDYVHLGNHAWYNGTAWQSDGSMGGLYQISGQQHAWYTHNGAGSFSTLMTLNPSGNLGIGTASPGSKLFVGSGTPAVQTLAGLNVALGGASYVSASNGTENIFMGSDGSGYGILGTLSNHALGFRTNNAERVRIDTSGNVGIGTAAPIAKLHVAGDGKVTGNLTVDGNIAAKYQDVAEWVPAARVLPPGTVVTLNRTHSNLVEASSQAYDTRVAGVISTQPGIALGEQSENKVLVATTGRVRIKVDATNCPIEIGDLLVTSDLEGFAMKSQAVNVGGVWIHRPGTIIGKALEPLANGIGEILVLLSLQ